MQTPAQPQSNTAVKWMVVGINGVTCGGKTTLANALTKFLFLRAGSVIPNTKYKVGDVKIISQDDYFLQVDDERHTWIESLNHINWEILTALDMKKMICDISALIKEDQYLIKRPTTNPSSWLCDDSIVVNFLIIEGFLLFNQPEILDICQLKYHVHIPYEKCWARRSVRTYDPPDVVGYFEMIVWPMYEKHLGEFKDREDVAKINGDLSPDRLLKYILNNIQIFLQIC